MEPNAASVAIIDGSRVLLIQRAFEPLAGLWTLPGGRREAGETIEETARREVYEELQLEVSALLPVMTMAVGATFRLSVFATQTFAGDIVASAEVTAYRWLRRDEIGALPPTPRLAEVLDSAFALFDRT